MELQASSIWKLQIWNTVRILIFNYSHFTEDIVDFIYNDSEHILDSNEY